MSAWLVGHVPAWLLLLGLVLLVVGGAILVQILVRRRFPGLRGDEHNDVTRFAFGVVGFVFAFFIGFVVSVMWGQINDADGRARAEGAAGVQLARDMTVFDQADQDRLRQSLLDYQRAALVEWDAAARGHDSHEASDALTQVYTAYAQVDARTELQKTMLSTSMANLDSLSQAHTQRVLQARTDIGPPWSLWVIIFLTSGLLLGCAIIYGVENPATHFSLVAILGVLVGANLFLVMMLAHPFLGEIATSPEPLHEVVRVLETGRP